MPVNRLPSVNGSCINGVHPGSRTASSSSPDSCSAGDLDDDLEAGCCTSQTVNGNLSVAIHQTGIYFMSVSLKN